MNIKWIAAFALCMAVIIFTAQNHHSVEVAFLWWSFQTSKAIVIFAVFFVGFLLGWILSLVSRRRK